MGSTGALFLILALGIVVFRGWLAAALSALSAVNEAGVRRAASLGERPAAAVARLLDRDDLRAALLLWREGCGLAVVTLVLLALSLRPEPPETWLAVHLAALAVVVALGELAPRTWGRLHAERLAYTAAPRLLRLARLPGVCSRMVQGLGLALLGGEEALAGPARLVTAADIQVAADLGEASGEVQPEVGRMLDEVIELTSTTVREVMTPRVEIVGLPADAGVDTMLEVAIESGLTRLPVYDGDLDNLLGVLNINDLLARLTAGERDFTARELARPALLTPETRRAGEMLREMRERATHLAIVIDDSGGTAGLVTIEDILEELVGDIHDEHDVEEAPVILIAPGEAVAEGRARLEEVAEALQVELPPVEAETVGGLFAWLLGSTIREGEAVTLGGLRWVVEEEEGQYVTRARITRLTGESD